MYVNESELFKFAMLNSADDIKNTDSCKQCVTLAAVWWIMSEPPEIWSAQQQLP